MDMVTASIQTHVIMVGGLFAIIAFNLYHVLYNQDFIKTAVWLKRSTPLFHGLNFSIVYTGAIVAAYVHQLVPEVILMIIASLMLMILEIKRFKKQRIIKSKDYAMHTEFRAFAKKIYIKEAIIIVLVSLIAFVL
jgi:hypothetical protein